MPEDTAQQPEKPGPQTIVQLTAENVKRLMVVEITPDPDGNMVVIGGDNGQGKTSVLDTIEMILGGKDSLPDRPIRDGASKCRGVLKTQDFILERTVSQTGTALIARTADGSKINSPQALIDSLTSTISFDPLSFQRMKPDEQAAKLRALAGLDFTQLDSEREAAYSSRTNVNRDVKAQQAKCDGLNRHPDAPAALVTSDEVMAKLETAQTTNRENDQKRGKLVGLNDLISDKGEAVSRADAEVKRIQAELTRAEAALKAAKLAEAETIADRDALRKEVDALTDTPLDTFKEELKTIEATNEKVRANIVWKEEQQKLVGLTKQAAELTEKISKIDAEKAKTISAAKFPIEGLGFEDNQVTFNGLPFSQASGAEQLRVSVAIGFAMQPTLKIALIRDGSLLDKKSLALVSQTAAKYGGQCWLEVVGDGAECSVIMEAGQVKEDRTKKEPV